MSDLYWQDTNWIDEALEDRLGMVGDRDFDPWNEGLCEDEFLYEFWDEFEEDEAE